MAKFDVNLKDDPAAAIDKVKGLIAQHGGTLEGDQNSGSFEGMTPAGMVRGTYAIAGRTATIDIVDKPWMVPQSMIEQVVRDYFTA